MTKSGRLFRVVAAVVYSTTIGYLVFGLFWFTFHRWLPPAVNLAIASVLGIRVTALSASLTSIAMLNWQSIWLGTAAGVAAFVVAALGGIEPHAEPARILLVPVLITTITVVATAHRIPAPVTSHFYHSSRFARFLHSLQGLILFVFSLPASILWAWTRPYVFAVTLSAFVLWKLWDGACPVTLAENAARTREGLPIMPPDSGFIPDVLARFGITVSGHAVGLFLYGLGVSLCSWIGYTWLF